MNNAVAVITANIIFVKAMLAERMRVILDGVLLVDPLGTVVADYGQAIRAVLAEPIAFHFKHLVNCQLDALHRSLHKFLFRSLVVPPFRLVKLNTLQQAAS